MQKDKIYRKTERQKDKNTERQKKQKEAGSRPYKKYRYYVSQEVEEISLNDKISNLIWTK